MATFIQSLVAISITAALLSSPILTTAAYPNTNHRSVAIRSAKRVNPIMSLTEWNAVRTKLLSRNVPEISTIISSEHGITIRPIFSSEDIPRMRYSKRHFLESCANLNSSDFATRVYAAVSTWRLSDDSLSADRKSWNPVGMTSDNELNRIGRFEGVRMRRENGRIVVTQIGAVLCPD